MKRSADPILKPDDDDPSTSTADPKRAIYLMPEGDHSNGTLM
eukprot:gene25477-30759_t